MNSPFGHQREFCHLTCLRLSPVSTFNQTTETSWRDNCCRVQDHAAEDYCRNGVRQRTRHGPWRTRFEEPIAAPHCVYRNSWPQAGTPHGSPALATYRNVVESMPYTPSLGQALDKNEFSEVFTPFWGLPDDHQLGAIRERSIRQSPYKPTTYVPLTKLPDLPPCFSSSLIPVITMPRSTALHMS